MNVSITKLARPHVLHEDCVRVTHLCILETCCENECSPDLRGDVGEGEEGNFNLESRNWRLTASP